MTVQISTAIFELLLLSFLNNWFEKESMQIKFSNAKNV